MFFAFSIGALGAIWLVAQGFILIVQQFAFFIFYYLLFGDGVSSVNAKGKMSWDSGEIFFASNSRLNLGPSPFYSPI